MHDDNPEALDCLLQYLYGMSTKPLEDRIDDCPKNASDERGVFAMIIHLFILCDKCQVEILPDWIVNLISNPDVTALYKPEVRLSVSAMGMMEAMEPLYGLRGNEPADRLRTILVGKIASCKGWAHTSEWRLAKMKNSEQRSTR